MGMNQISEENLVHVFRIFNRFMVFMWRLGLGNWINLWPDGTGRILILTHFGRSSGKKYRTPVNYAIVDNEIYCTAAFGNGSDWYLNIKKTPDVQVWLSDGWWAGKAHDVSESEDRFVILRKVLLNSGFAAKTFAGIDPEKASYAEFAKATSSYKLVRIEGLRACTGSGGPGDLAFIWPLFSFLLLPFFLLLIYGKMKKRNN